MWTTTATCETCEYLVVTIMRSVLGFNLLSGCEKVASTDTDKSACSSGMLYV